MRILTRYILSEVTSHAVLGIVVFTFVLFTRDLGHILELVVRNSASVYNIAEIIALTLPVAFTYTLPMSVLLGILIGLSRLAADSEITAMRATGFGVWTFLRVISIFVGIVWVLALFNGVYLAPWSQGALSRLQDRIKGSQVSFEVQPRVFYEGFPKLVLYVQDVKSAQGAAIWKGVFIADISTPSSPKITLAQQGILLSEGPETLHLRLTDGSTHEADATTPGQYQISTFQQSDLPISIPQAGTRQEQESATISQLSTFELPVRAKQKSAAIARLYRIEFHRRFALPTACLVLALIGIPLGLSSRKGGKSSGFVLTILLVFAYYSFSLIGVSLARQGTVSAAFGVWLADGVAVLVGAFLLWHAERRPFDMDSASGIWKPLTGGFSALRQMPEHFGRPDNAFDRASSRLRVFRARFPMILDDYVLRDFVVNLAMITATFLILVLVFTLFELLGDILHNQISPLIVGEYLLDVSPFFLYNLAPINILLAVLVTLGLMQHSNEMTAIKASGISIYRIVLPLAVAAVLVASSLFVFDQFYLPYANKRQDQLRNIIKGKPAQTYLSPDRKWIMGQHSAIYYYQVFDSDRDEFGGLSIFQLDPATFSMSRRIHAERAHWETSIHRWIFTQGWERVFRGPAIDDFRTFDVAAFPTIGELPVYFKKEVKQSSEMNYEELRRYIRDLQQGGFDVVRLKVQLQKKLAFPLVVLVMAILAIPFSLSAGQRGALTGVAFAVGIAMTYLTISNLFEVMGNISQLPPMVAAWSPDVIFALVGGYLILKVPT